MVLLEAKSENSVANHNSLSCCLPTAQRSSSSTTEHLRAIPINETFNQAE